MHIDAIEAARKRLGLTMEELAARAGRDASTYSKVVSGAIKPRAKILASYVDALEAFDAEQKAAAARLDRLGAGAGRAA